MRRENYVFCTVSMTAYAEFDAWRVFFYDEHDVEHIFSPLFAGNRLRIMEAPKTYQ